MTIVTLLNTRTPIYKIYDINKIIKVKIIIIIINRLHNKVTKIFGANKYSTKG